MTAGLVMLLGLRLYALCELLHGLLLPDARAPSCVLCR